MKFVKALVIVLTVLSLAGVAQAVVGGVYEMDTHLYNCVDNENNSIKGYSTEHYVLVEFDGIGGLNQRVFSVYLCKDDTADCSNPSSNPILSLSIQRFTEPSLVGNARTEAAWKFLKDLEPTFYVDGGGMKNGLSFYVVDAPETLELKKVKGILKWSVDPADRTVFNSCNMCQRFTKID